MFPILKTIESIFSAKLIRFFISSIFISLGIFLLFGIFVFWIAGFLLEVEMPYLKGTIQSFIFLGIGIVGWFMLPSLIPIIASFFQEKVVDRVDRVFYPDQVLKKQPQWFPNLKHDLTFLFWALLLNILILPFYLWGVGIVLSVILNTYLLGREFFEMASGYYLGRQKAKELRQQHRLIIYAGGFVITCMTFVPLFNLLVPILAIVWMVHLYHRIR